MKKLGKDTFNRAGSFIANYARPLERAVFKDYFEASSSQDIVKELKKYQNVDGGFGRGLESDFRLPYSSPMAASIAFQHFSKLDCGKDAFDMIREGIHYLEKAFNPERVGWFAVPREVNEFPHAPWWHFSHEEGMCAIDRHWGNPSAELIGYLYKYKSYVEKLDVDNLLNYAIDYLNSKESFESFHEIFCYIRLYNLLPEKISSRFEHKLDFAVQKLVSRNIGEWDTEYVAKPLDFISGPEYTFGIDDDLIEENLHYIIEKLEQNDVIMPSWSKEFYANGMEAAWDEWIGVLTLKALIILDRFDRID